MKLSRSLITAVAVILPAISVNAQTVVTPAQLNGEWRGTLVLDNSSPQLILAFEVTDSTFAGKVYADGDLMGPMEDGTRDRNRVHFKVGRFDFAGVVTGSRMKIDLIVFNGTTRTFTAIKTAPARDTTSRRP